MNTGGGSVFHRQRWVIFRATLTPGSTHVSTTVQATARPLTFSADPVRCASNGTLETLIVKRIKEGLQQ